MQNEPITLVGCRARRLTTARFWTRVRGSRRAGWIARVAGSALLFLVCIGAGAQPLLTPLEQSGFQRITGADEVGGFLDALVQAGAVARSVVLGKSVAGRPIHALIVAQTPEAVMRGEAPGRRLRVMAVGSQHGGEVSGAEAILMLARDLVTGPERALLTDIEFILVPLGNPDGRALRKRENANGIDIGTDYLTLSQPESRAIRHALTYWQPDAVIDLHESAVYKPRTLARFGYMTDFETQLETANNPNIDPAVTALARERIVPVIFERLRGQGLEAEWYVAEITRLDKALTHGGTTLKTLRNLAGIDGALSLLVESRLDPSAGDYPTPHNIRARATKQLMALRAWIAALVPAREEVAARTRAAREAWREANLADRLYLSSGYGLIPGRETISIRLRRIADGQIEHRTFAYLGQIIRDAAHVPPAAYAITAHQSAIARVLERHRIGYEVLGETRQCEATIPHVALRELVPGARGEETWRTRIDERKARVTLPAGTLWIPLAQPARRLIPLLLEPRSNSSIFEHPSAAEDYSDLVAAGRDFFVLRMGQDCHARTSVPAAS